MLGRGTWGAAAPEKSRSRPAALSQLVSEPLGTALLVRRGVFFCGVQALCHRGQHALCLRRGGNAWPGPAAPAGAWLCPELAGSQALVTSLPGHSGALPAQQMTQEQQQPARSRAALSSRTRSRNSISCSPRGAGPGAGGGGIGCWSLTNGNERRCQSCPRSPARVDAKPFGKGRCFVTAAAARCCWARF